MSWLIAAMVMLPDGAGGAQLDEADGLAGPGSAGVEVKGTVRLKGDAPRPKEIELEELMARNMNQKTFREETYLVDERGGLQNCVVTLTSLEADPKQPPQPLEKTSMAREGVRYVPRVLVVTPGTEIVLRNPTSPCRGFNIGPKRVPSNASNQMIFEGQQKSVRLQGPDECSVTCTVRPYAQGFILVVNTPYFAVTDAKGSFRIPNVPPGRYRWKVWHEAARSVTLPNAPSEISVGDQASGTLELSVEVPGAKKPVDGP